MRWTTIARRDLKGSFDANGGKMDRAMRHGLLILALIGAGLSHACTGALAQSQGTRPVAIAAPGDTAWRLPPPREPPLHERSTADLPTWKTVALGRQPSVIRLREALQTPPFVLGDILARARQLGFKLCPAEVGPALRLAYRDQPIGEFLHIGMKPLMAGGGEARDFTLGNAGTGLLLLGGDAAPDLVVSWTTRFVLVVPGNADLNAVSKR